MLVNERDVPYQTLLKLFLANRVAWELKGRMANIGHQ
jgi:hypothetical protein